MYEVRNSLISHVNAARIGIVVDEKTVAQTELVRDVKQAVWDDVLVVDVPLYSQLIKAAAVGQNFVLGLKIMAGRDLEAMDLSGTSDPYVKIEMGVYAQKTQIIYKNLNPEWYEDFEMTIDDMSVPLHISVWDNDLLGADDLIGGIFIRLDELMDTNPHKIQSSFQEWFTIKRNHKATGDIQLGFSFTAPDNESPATEKQLGSATIDVSRMQVGEEQIGWHRLVQGQEHYTISVQVLQGAGFMPVDGVTADPFVRFSLGRQVFKTVHVKQNCNPVWEDERYSLRVSSLNQVLRCEVFDYNQFSSHVFLGEYWVQMKDLVVDEETDRWYDLMLKPSQKDVVAQRHRDGESLGEIRLKMCLRKTKVPACELKLGVKLLRAPAAKRPHRNDRIVHYRKIRGVGTLQLSVVSAANMQGYEPCRPWVEVTCGKQLELIKRATGSDHPCWDAPLSIPVAPGTKTLTCKIFAMGPKKRKYMLGETCVFLDPLKDSGEVDAWYRLDGRNPLGKLQLRILSCTNLLAADANGKSDPFVEVAVGKKKYKTKTKMKTRDPVYGEEFMFDIWSIQDRIELEVFDWDAVGANDLLGRKTVELTDIFLQHKDGKGFGEGRFRLSQKHMLEGLNGTDFVDAEQTERVQGSILIEMSYQGDPALLEKVGFLRLVTSYICPAKSVSEAAEMELLLVEGGSDGEDYDPWDEEMYDEVESALTKAIGNSGACLSKAKLVNSPASFNLSESSLDAQMNVFKINGGQVMTAKQVAEVRSRPTTKATAGSSRPPTILGPGMKRPKPPMLPSSQAKATY